MTAVLRAAGVAVILLTLFYTGVPRADSIDPPDIHSQTLQEYAALGDFLAEAHIRRSMYLDSLGSELRRLYVEVDSLLLAMPDMQEKFRESHRLFLSYTETWSAFLEEIQWRDPATGEPVYGSVYGYTSIQVSAALYWERILLYRAFADGGLTGGFGEITIPSDMIGGY